MRKQNMLVAGLAGLGAAGLAAVLVLSPATPDAQAQFGGVVIFDAVTSVDVFGSGDTLGISIRGTSPTGGVVHLDGNGDVEQNAGIDAAYRRCMNFAVKVFNKPTKRDLQVFCDSGSSSGGNVACDTDSAINCTLGGQGSF